MFGGIQDQHVTAKNPYKLLNKASILEDLIQRAAVSDWAPLKEELRAYEGDDVLIVFNVDCEYGQNFYVILDFDLRKRYTCKWKDGAVEAAVCDEIGAPDCPEYGIDMVERG
eukprot:Clim_evm10s146 gene=Clim_evmTU10s146